jgi:hypothetical protein
MSEDLDADIARRALWAAVALGAVVRVAYFLSKWSSPLLVNDSLYYAGQAHQLLRGVWFREVFFPEHPGAEHGPLTSILMAPVSIGDDFYRWQRLVTVTTGIVLVWVIGRCATEVANRRAGVVAAFIAALYPNLWMNDGLVMSESVSMLCVGLALWAAWRLAHAADGRAAWRAAALLGVVLGLGVLARSELAVFVPLVVVWVAVARRRVQFDWRPALLALVAAGVLVSPWVVFNLTRFERPVMLTTNDGTTWLGANCDPMYGGGDAGGWTIECIVADPDYRADEEPSVRSARHRSMGLRYMADHVTEVPKVMVLRVARTLDLYGLSDLVHQDVGEERPRWAAWAGIVMFWLLAAAAAVGVRRLPRRAWSLLVIPFVVVLTTTLLFYGGHRIRSTAEPSLVILSGVAVAWWWSRRRPVH